MYQRPKRILQRNNSLKEAQVAVVFRLKQRICG